MISTAMTPAGEDLLLAASSELASDHEPVGVIWSLPPLTD
jgi:hypothetical protein